MVDYINLYQTKKLKMKHNFILLTLFLCPFYLFSQVIFGPRNEIIGPDRSVLEPDVIKTVDIDLDGDLDVITCDWTDGSLLYFENLDGEGTFGTKQIIHEDLGWINSLNVFDVNQDGYEDLVFSVRNKEKISWVANLNGSGTFSPEIFFDGFVDITNIEAGDLDGDDDKDIVIASFTEGYIKWYANDNGFDFNTQGTVFAQGSIYFPSSVKLADFDGDQDLDIAVASESDNAIVWFENEDGQANFGPAKVIANLPDVSNQIYPADIDGDNDMDLFSLAQNTVVWYENLDGKGNFGNQTLLTDQFELARIMKAEDLDNDGDVDLVVGAQSFNDLIWFENLDGQGNFSLPHIINEHIYTVNEIHTADVDGDGDQDVLSVSDDAVVAWHENNNNAESFEEKFIAASVRL